MIESDEQVLNRQALCALQASSVEIGDDPRSYHEIALSLGLLVVPEMELQPAAESTV